MSSYYRTESVIWDDEEFCAADDLSRSVWFVLRTGPQRTSLPGLQRAGVASLAETLRRPVRAVKRAIKKFMDRGSIEFDEERRVLRILNAQPCDHAESPNQIRAWWNRWNEIPRCPAKFKHVASLKALARLENPKHAEAWAATFATVEAEACRESEAWRVELLRRPVAIDVSARCAPLRPIAPPSNGIARVESVCVAAARWRDRPEDPGPPVEDRSANPSEGLRELPSIPAAAVAVSTPTPAPALAAGARSTAPSLADLRELDVDEPLRAAPELARHGNGARAAGHRTDAAPLREGTRTSLDEQPPSSADVAVETAGVDLPDTDVTRAFVDEEEAQAANGHEAYTRAIPPAAHRPARRLGAWRASSTPGVLTEMPRDLPLTPEARAYAEMLGVRDIDTEWLKYRARQRKMGITGCDWYAGWELWVLDSKRFQDTDRARAAARARMDAPPAQPRTWVPGGGELPELEEPGGSS